MLTVQTRKRTRPSYHNNRSLLQRIDELPTGPDWICDEVTLTGDREDDAGLFMIKELKLWLRDPVEVVKELLGNLSFCEHIALAPEKVCHDSEGRVRVYDEMWTGDWWWDILVSAVFTTKGGLNLQRH